MRVPILLGLIAAGCGAAESPPPEPTVAEMVEELRVKNTALDAKYGIGQGGRWDVDQDTATLVFSDANGTPQQRCRMQIVGDVSTRSGTWMWSWGNSSVEPRCKDRMDEVRRYGREHGLAHWDERVFEATEEDGWEFAAVATHVLQGVGAYRGPADHSAVFLVMLSIEDLRPAGK
jgi:hypothetical protein